MIAKHEQVVVSEKTSIFQALKVIDKNTLGLVLTANEELSIVGLATDGDIRRHLILGGDLEDPVSECQNVDFVYEKEGASRETLLKLLDYKVKTIPILDNEGRFKRFVGISDLDHEYQNEFFARSRAPFRISFAGGGSDLTSYFLENNKGAVLNASLNHFVRASLTKRKDKRVIVNSFDLNIFLDCHDLDDFFAVEETALELLKSVLKRIRPNFGFELNVSSDLRSSSGLAGSSAFVSSILGCFNEFRLDQWTRHELVEMAFQCERLEFENKGGWQDQYASIFGGFNFIEFRRDGNVLLPLRVPQDVLVELEECLLLCDVGGTHDSGKIQSVLEKNLVKENVSRAISENVDLCYDIRNCLLSGKIDQIGYLLDKAWKLKQQFSHLISSEQANEIYDFAKLSGAKGGKLLGAGGGGYFLFFVGAESKVPFLKSMLAKNIRAMPVHFSERGLYSWKVRQNEFEA